MRVSSPSISTLRTRRASRIRPRRASSRASASPIVGALRMRGSARPCGSRGRTKLAGSLHSGLLTRLKERADAEAIGVFSDNLKDLLLAAPAGPRTTMGLDPGIRTGVKVAVVDATGKVVATTTIYPHEPKRDWQGSLAALASLVHEAQGGHHQRRQRHGRARDRQARRRADGQDAGAQADQGNGVGGRRLCLFGFRAGSQGVSRSRRQPARCGVDRAAAAGSPRPSSSRSSPRPSASGNISTTSTRAVSRARSMLRSRIASTQSASTSTRPRCRCWRTCRASIRRLPPTSSPSATRTAPSRRASR